MGAASGIGEFGLAIPQDGWRIALAIMGFLIKQVPIE